MTAWLTQAEEGLRQAAQAARAETRVLQAKADERDMLANAVRSWLIASDALKRAAAENWVRQVFETIEQGGA